MNYREQAIQDVAQAFNSPVLGMQYAVAQRERVLRLEETLRDCMNHFNMTRLIMPPVTGKQFAEWIAANRAILDAKQK